MEVCRAAGGDYLAAIFLCIYVITDTSVTNERLEKSFQPLENVEFIIPEENTKCSMWYTVLAAAE